MTINPDDLDIVTGCAASHPDRMGGQHVARKCTGVRITHRPTGTSVLVDTERSQHANRIKATIQLHAELERKPHP